MPITIKDTTIKKVMEEFRTGVLIANTVATLASTSADGGADTDSRNENIRNINQLNLDHGLLFTKVNDLLTRLRDKGIISN